MLSNKIKNILVRFMNPRSRPHLLVLYKTDRTSVFCILGSFLHFCCKLVFFLFAVFSPEILVALKFPNESSLVTSNVYNRDVIKGSLRGFYTPDIKETANSQQNTNSWFKGIT